MPAEHAQRFGGPWSLLKVEAVEKYLRAYATVMSRQSFDLTYIDAFAGSGSFTFGEGMTLIPADEAAQVFAGSVKRALAVSAFKQFFFIENDERNVASLRTIAGSDPRVEIIAGDANAKLIDLCQRLDWKNRRGVVFVDPCGPETNWAMLRAIAATKALDVFWLFVRHRQTQDDISACRKAGAPVGRYKGATLQSIFRDSQSQLGCEKSCWSYSTASA